MSFLPDKHTRGLGLNKNAFYLGLISLALQVVLARLAVGFAGGNEIYLTLFFLLWLLFTGIGAVFIKSKKTSALFILLNLLALIAPALFYIAPRLIGILPGQLIPPVAFIVTITVTLAPICLTNGALFSSIAAGVDESLKTSRIYWAEALGALGGGALVTLMYLTGIRDYTMILLIVISGLSSHFIKRKVIRSLTALLIMLVFFWGLGNPIENALLRWRYKPFDYLGSVSGRMVRYDAVKTSDITTLYAGGMKVGDFPDDVAAQEIFYWPLLIKPNIKNIAMIGVESPLVREFIPKSIFAYFISPETDWLDLLDGDYFKLHRGYIKDDPVFYFKNHETKYDAIIINLGDLLSLYDKRLETRYFLDLCSKGLRPYGMLFVRLPAYEGLWPDELKSRINDIYENLRSLFGNVRVIPGDHLYFAAGLIANTDKDYLIANLEKSQIESSYFTPALIRSRLNDFKLDEVSRQLNENTRRVDNLVIGPGLDYYFSRFKEGFNFLNSRNIWTLLILFAIILLAVLIGQRGRRLASIALINIVFFGMASFCAELLVLYKFQLMGGYLYIALGILIGLFMFGLASGSYLGTSIIMNRANVPTTIRNGSILTLVVMAAAVAIITLISHNIILLLISLALAGFAGGLGFTLNAGYFDKNPGLPYGYDLAGAFMGTSLGTAILLGSLSAEIVLGVVLVSGIILIATNRALC